MIMCVFDFVKQPLFFLHAATLNEESKKANTLHEFKLSHNSCSVIKVLCIQSFHE